MKDDHRYDDIISLPHPDPEFHPRMSEMDRAAQFAPFAALTGYDEMVSEKSRCTDERIELDEEQCLSLNEALSDVISRIGKYPAVAVTWFRKDSRKSGGAYVRSEGRVRDVELPGRLMILTDGRKICLDDIVSLVLL